MPYKSDLGLPTPVGNARLFRSKESSSELPLPRGRDKQKKINELVDKQCQSIIWESGLNPRSGLFEIDFNEGGSAFVIYAKTGKRRLIELGNGNNLQAEMKKTIAAINKIYGGRVSGREDLSVPPRYRSRRSRHERSRFNSEGRESEIQNSYCSGLSTRGPSFRSLGQRRVESYRHEEGGNFSSTRSNASDEYATDSEESNVGPTKNGREKRNGWVRLIDVESSDEGEETNEEERSTPPSNKSVDKRSVSTQSDPSQIVEPSITSTLSARVTTQQKQINSLTTSIEEQSKRLEKYCALRQELMAWVKELEGKKEKAAAEHQREKEALKQKYNTLNIEHLTLIEKLSSYEKKASFAQEKLNEALGQKQKIETDLVHLQENFNRSSETIKELDAQLKDASGRNQLSQNEAEHQSSLANQQAKQENLKFKSALEKKGGELEAANQQISALNESLAQSCLEKTTTNKLLSSSESQLKSLIVEIKKMSDDFKKLESEFTERRNALALELRKKDEEISVVSAQNARFTTQLTALTQQLSTATDSLNTASNTLLTVEKEKITLKAEIERLREAIAQVDQERKDALDDAEGTRQAFRKAAKQHEQQSSKEEQTVVQLRLEPNAAREKEARLEELTGQLSRLTAEKEASTREAKKERAICLLGKAYNTRLLNAALEKHQAAEKTLGATQEKLAVTAAQLKTLETEHKARLDQLEAQLTETRELLGKKTKETEALQRQLQTKKAEVNTQLVSQAEELDRQLIKVDELDLRKAAFDSAVTFALKQMGEEIRRLKTKGVADHAQYREDYKKSEPAWTEKLASLQLELKKTQELLHNSDAANTKLALSEAEAKQKATEAKNGAEKLQQEIGALKRDKEKNEGALVVLQEGIDALQQSLLKAQTEAQSSDETTRKQAKQIDGLKTDLASARAKKEEMQASLQAQEKLLTEALETQRVKTEEAKTAAERAAELAGLLKAQEELNKTQTAALENLTTKYTRLGEELTLTTTTLQEAQTAGAASKQKAQDTEQRILSIGAELTQAQAQLDALKALLGQQKTELVELRALETKHVQEIADLRTQLTSIQKEMTALQEKKATAEALLLTSQEKFKARELELSEECKRLKAQVGTLEAQVGELGKKVSELGVEARRAEEIARNAQAEKTVAERRALASETALLETRTSLEAALLKAKQENDAARKANAEKEAEIQAKIGRLAIALAELDGTAKENATLTTQLTQLKGELVRLRAENEEAEKQHRVTIAKLTTKLTQSERREANNLEALTALLIDLEQTQRELLASQKENTSQGLFSESAVEREKILVARLAELQGMLAKQSGALREAEEQYRKLADSSEGSDLAGRVSAHRAEQLNEELQRAKKALALVDEINEQLSSALDGNGPSAPGGLGRVGLGGPRQKKPAASQLDSENLLEDLELPEGRNSGPNQAEDQVQKLRNGVEALTATLNALREQLKVAERRARETFVVLEARHREQMEELQKGHIEELQSAARFSLGAQLRAERAAMQRASRKVDAQVMTSSAASVNASTQAPGAPLGTRNVQPMDSTTQTSESESPPPPPGNTSGKVDEIVNPPPVAKEPTGGQKGGQGSPPGETTPPPPPVPRPTGGSGDDDLLNQLSQILGQGPQGESISVCIAETGHAQTFNNTRFELDWLPTVTPELLGFVTTLLKTKKTDLLEQSQSPFAKTLCSLLSVSTLKEAKEKLGGIEQKFKSKRKEARENQEARITGFPTQGPNTEFTPDALTILSLAILSQFEQNEGTRLLTKEADRLEKDQREFSRLYKKTVASLGFEYGFHGTISTRQQQCLGGFTELCSTLVKQLQASEVKDSKPMAKTETISDMARHPAVLQFVTYYKHLLRLSEQSTERNEALNRARHKLEMLRSITCRCSYVAAPEEGAHHTEHTFVVRLGQMADRASSSESLTPPPITPPLALTPPPEQNSVVVDLDEI